MCSEWWWTVILVFPPPSRAGVCSADPAGARHAMALASLAARDPHGVRLFIDEVGPLIKNNVDLAKSTGGGAGGRGGRWAGGRAADQEQRRPGQEHRWGGGGRGGAGVLGWWTA